MFIQTITQFRVNVEVSNHALKQTKDDNGEMQNKSYSGRFTDLDMFRHVRTYSGINRHNQAYSGVIKAYSKRCVILAYSEPLFIQNPGISRARDILKTLPMPCGLLGFRITSSFFKNPQPGNDMAFHIIFPFYGNLHMSKHWELHGF